MRPGGFSPGRRFRRDWLPSSKVDWRHLAPTFSFLGVSHAQRDSHRPRWEGAAFNGASRAHTDNQGGHMDMERGSVCRGPMATASREGAYPVVIHEPMRPEPTVPGDQVMVFT